MWNWNIYKSLLLAFVVGALSALAGFSVKASVIITIGITFLIDWLVKEINFIREAHGSDLEELESKIEELEEKVSKLESKKKS